MPIGGEQPADEQRDQPAELPEHVEAGEDPTARVLGGVALQTATSSGHRTSWCN
jgi:hypothetical protein